MINETNLEFTDISSEAYRTYEYLNGYTITIYKPTHLHVSDNGHRIFDFKGISHYIPVGWIHLSWQALPNKPNFVK